MQFHKEKERILIIDFGSQLTKLIARRIRELGVYSEVITLKQANKLKSYNNIKGIIFSGGPSSVTKKNFQSAPKKVFTKKIPILGICYGLQLIAKTFGGKIKPSRKRREFGRAFLYKKTNSLLTKNFLNSKTSVWMSHEDAVVKLPKNFKAIAATNNSKLTIIENTKKRIYGVQFHPEVTHTNNGKQLFKNFLFLICKIRKKWNIKSQKIKLIEEIKNVVKKDKVICALSGGVDSSVVAQLLNKAIGKKLYCIFVNTGLLRKNEEIQVIQTFKKRLKMNLIYVNAENEILGKIKNDSDPDKK